MGLFDKLLSQGAKALGNIVTNAVSDALSQGQNGSTGSLSAQPGSFSGQPTQTASSGSFRGQSAQAPAPQTAQVSAPQAADPVYIEPSFDKKLLNVLSRIGDYRIVRNIAPEQLAAEFSTPIYPTGKKYCPPSTIPYGIYKGDERVLLIRLWYNYRTYSNCANRQIRIHCEQAGIRILDFFFYLPNEEDYMEQRLRKNLV